jgi:hypothetical protein
MVKAFIEICTNEGKSAAIFCRQVAAWIPDMFCNFYSVKNHKIAKKLNNHKRQIKNKHIFAIP